MPLKEIPHQTENLVYEPSCNFCAQNQNNGSLPGGMFDRFYNFKDASSNERVGYETPIVDLNGISSDNVVYTDLVPLAPNHLMLIPESHATSSALLPNRQSLHDDAEVITDFLRTFSPERSIVIFEHGSGIGSDNSLVSMCSRVCDNTIHAHIHFLSAPMSSPYSNDTQIDWDYTALEYQLLDFLSPFGWDENSPISKSEILFESRENDFVGESPYLMMGVLGVDNSYQEITLLHNDDQLRQVPSQVFRRLLAQYMNDGKHVPASLWDYHHISASYIQDGFEYMIPRYRAWLDDLLTQVEVYNSDNIR